MSPRVAVPLALGRGCALVALALATTVLAQDAAPLGDALYQPKLRQPGKDVMWLPTPEAMVTRMLEAARTTGADTVYDLGAGEGRIPIAAARRFGAKAVGIEFDGALAALARRNAERAGVADRVTIVEGDIFKTDFTGASVVTLYLLPELNFQLRPQLLALKPGTRVVSHQWDMAEWEPDEAFRVADSDGFLWIVPADVAGRWTLAGRDGRWQGRLDLVQRFQRIGGTLTVKGRTQPLLGAWLRGANMGFTFVDDDGGVKSARLAIDGDAASGQVAFPGLLIAVTAIRESAITAPATRRGTGGPP